MSVSGGDAVWTTLSGLMLSTNYSIEVAAIGGEYGIGVYSSPPVTVMTDGESHGCVIIIYDLCMQNQQVLCQYLTFLHQLHH